MSGLRALVVSAAVAVVFPASAQSDPFPVNRQPGTLVYWYPSSGTYPQSPMPYGRYTAVDGRVLRFIVLREDGAALSWRTEQYGGTAADFNLRIGPYVDVKISANMLLLKQTSGQWDAFRPPNEGGGIFSPPIPPLVFTNADTGGTFGAGVTPDGVVWGWGGNEYGQVDSPPGPFVDVACLNDTTCGLRPDGSVELWGQAAGLIEGFPDLVRIEAGSMSLYGQRSDGTLVCLRSCSDTDVPSEPVAEYDPFDAHNDVGNGVVWIFPDGSAGASNGIIPESRWQDIATADYGGTRSALGVVDTDCDGSGFFDRGEIAAGLISDCNGNLVPDSCETARHVVRTAEWLGQLVGDQPVSIEFTDLPPSARGIRLDVEAKGDLMGADRNLEVQFGDGGPTFTILADGGRACWQLGRDWSGLELSDEEFEAVLGGGQAITISITPSLPVASKSCTDGGLWLRLEYVAAAPDDCNANGIDDACEIVSGTVADDDGDGVPDGCGGSCLGDIDGDLAVGGADLAVLLSGWGQKGDTDLTGDGTTDGADLASLLSAWGACP
jgi:hypothetical protein